MATDSPVSTSTQTVVPAAGSTLHEGAMLIRRCLRASDEMITYITPADRKKLLALCDLLDDTP